MIEQIRMLSLLDSKPQFVYDGRSDVVLCAWRGVLMTRNQALALTMENYGIWPTPMQKQRLHEEYSRAFYSGAFGQANWQRTVESGNALDYLRRLLSEEATKGVQERYTAAQALLWFTRACIKPVAH